MKIRRLTANPFSTHSSYVSIFKAFLYLNLVRVSDTAEHASIPKYFLHERKYFK